MPGAANGSPSFGPDAINQKDRTGRLRSIAHSDKYGQAK
jgi:hypothetical protein